MSFTLIWSFDVIVWPVLHPVTANRTVTGASIAQKRDSWRLCPGCSGTTPHQTAVRQKLWSRQPGAEALPGSAPSFRAVLLPSFFLRTKLMTSSMTYLLSHRICHQIFSVGTGHIIVPRLWPRRWCHQFFRGEALWYHCDHCYVFSKINPSSLNVTLNQLTFRDEDF